MRACSCKKECEIEKKLILTILEEVRCCKVQHEHLHDREALSEATAHCVKIGKKGIHPLFSKTVSSHFDHVNEVHTWIQYGSEAPRRFLHRCPPNMLPFPVPNLIVVTLLLFIT